MYNAITFFCPTLLHSYNFLIRNGGGIRPYFINLETIMFYSFHLTIKWREFKYVKVLNILNKIERFDLINNLITQRY